MSSGQQQVVGAGGLALLLTNFWARGGRATIVKGALTSNNPAGVNAAHTELKKLGGQLLFVGAAALIAGTNDNLGTAMVVVVVALWILWLMSAGKSKGNGYGGGDWGPGSPTTPPTGGGSWFTAPATSGVGSAAGRA